MVCINPSVKSGYKKGRGEHGKILYGLLMPSGYWLCLIPCWFFLVSLLVFPLRWSMNPHTGKPLFDKHGRPCYNIDNYRFGFTSAVPLDGSDAVVGYLASYYTKNRKMIVPKGCKRYWASRNLVRPTVSYGDQDLMAFLRTRFVGAEYTKSIRSRFGSSIFAQTTEEQIVVQLEKWGKAAEAEPVKDRSYWREE